MKSYLMGFLTVTALVALGSHPAPTVAATSPTCMGRTVTIMGTDGPDNLTGQGGVSDVIYGGAGDDTIYSGDWYGDDAIPGHAPDYICGGAGNDYLTGSPGNDHINGGDGADHIEGILGNDVVRGNAGADNIIDESIADMDGGSDVMIGGPGPDRILIGWGYDRAEGNSGADTITDGECNPTTISGGPGDDYIESWTSSSEGWGAYVCSDGRFGTDIADKVDGGLGTDTSKEDVGDHRSNLEHVKIVRHGQYD